MIERRDLGGAWQWRRTDEQQWRAGRVPGSVLCDMLDAGLIGDPYWRENEYATRELMTGDYEYRRAFALTEKEFSFDRAELVLEGVDTLADIRVNGRLAAHVDDMHRTWRLDVKDLLRPGDNELSVTLLSSLNFVREAHKNSDIFYTSTGSIHGNWALRKGHSMFGWDWGPQLVDAGLFRPVYLEFTSGLRLADVRPYQRHENGQVDVYVEVAAESTDGELHGTVRAALTSPEGESLVVESELAGGRCLLRLHVEKPRLWWPNGVGEHPLYRLEVQLLRDGEVCDRREMNIGLRTVRLRTGADRYGSEFAFEVNGVPIFAMGANLIPQDCLLPRITRERTERLARDSAAANMNMLRVWGGGYYLDDDFYDACDRYGILLWHDLMFACNVYTLTPRFEENIIAETEDNVRRLRHHACLALWCGNNEMEVGWATWPRLEGHHPRYKRDYTLIFEGILPRVVARCDGETPWWPSSPSSGGAFYIPDSPDHGDQHYWDVWHSGKPFTAYREHYFRFCSEYGFQSFPSMKTIRAFTLPKDRNIFSRVMESHQKNGTANSKIFTYVAEYFRYPKDLSSVVMISQILQLKAIAYGVEYWRQNRGRCMGSLYWQLNDCWSVASWASLDYFGRWKALHYGARRFYAPRMASAFEKEELSGDIRYFMHNDTLETYHGKLTVRLMDAEMKVIRTCTAEADVPPMTALEVLHVDFEPDLTDGEARCRRLADYRLEIGEKTVSRGTNLFVKPKHFDLPRANMLVEGSEDATDFILTVRSDAFVYCAELDYPDADPVFSDNYFDITDPSGVTVRVEKTQLPGYTLQDAINRLTLRSVRDTYDEGEDSL